MKTILKDEYLKSENRVTGYGFDTGIINRTGSSKLYNAGYNVKEGELVGRFEGVRTFIDFIESGTVFGNREPNYMRDSSREDTRGSDWVRYKTYDEAVNKMLTEPQVFRSYTEADIKLKDYEAPTGNAIDYEITGDFIDVGRVLEGIPEAFGSMKNGNVTNKFASIVVAGMSHCGIEQETINERSSKVMRLVDMLEANNVRCRVTVVFSNDNWHCEIVTKQYQDKLDIDDIAVATSADFFRRLQFSFAEHSQTKSSNYGRAGALQQKTYIDDDCDINILVGNGYKYGWQEHFETFEKLLLDNGITYGDTADLNNGYLVYNGSQI